VSPLSRMRAAASTTPGLYRVLSLVVAALLALTALAGTIAAGAAERATARLRDNTGPVLVATQSLLASLAEADAAATAALLSGAEEDREQRRLYEEALARASVQSEEISALIGDDADAHDDLKRLSIRINRYAGLIEAARATSRLGSPDSEQYLLAALDELATGVRADAASLTEASERRFDRDERERSRFLVVAVVIGVVALTALAATGVVLARRSRRLINPLLLLATLVTLASVGWLASSDVRAGRRLDLARDEAYQSIALTARIQSAAFAARTDESVALIADDADRRTSADSAATDVLAGSVDEGLLVLVREGQATDVARGLLVDAALAADTARERAAVAEAMVRWQRYRETVSTLRSSSGDAARAVAVGPGSATFNGFNFSLEAVLGENRDQFLDAIERARDATRYLATITLFLPLLAAAAALAGIQTRINEYR
jgi:hypothetical protein